MLGPNNYETQNKQLLELDVADEQIDTIGRALLGISFGCARCHDHKFDPFSTREYYSLAGILLSTKSLEHDNVSKWSRGRLPLDTAVEARVARLEQARAELEAKLQPINQQLARFDGPATAKPADPQALAGLVIEAEEAELVGQWKRSTHSPWRVGQAYYHDDNSGKGTKAAIFTFSVPEADRYEIRLAYAAASGRAPNVPVIVRHGGVERRLHLDQRRRPEGGRFQAIGRYFLVPDVPVTVRIETAGTSGHVIVDAIQVLREHEAAALQALSQRRRQLQTELDRVLRKLPSPEWVMCVQEQPRQRIGDMRILKRGNPESPGAVVKRGVPTFLPGLDKPEVPKGRSGRLALARWLTDPANPLTTRVYVNRIWHYLFGRGLVRSTDNFGTTGERPSHPELLDFLARWFQARGWSTKRLIREIILSHTFAVGPRAPEGAVEVDPENRLLSHFPRRRLEAEVLRDAMLYVSGELDLAMGGPSLPPALRKIGKEEKEVRSLRASKRRSVYLPLLRNLTPEYYRLFDGANTSVVTGRRSASTTALQALYMMNNRFVLDRARAASEKLLREGPSETTARVRYAFLAALTRDPSPNEREACLRLLADEPELGWQMVFHALFSCAEFRYVE